MKANLRNYTGTQSEINAVLDDYENQIMINGKEGFTSCELSATETNSGRPETINMTVSRDDDGNITAEF